MNNEPKMSVLLIQKQEKTDRDPCRDTETCEDWTLNSGEEMKKQDELRGCRAGMWLTEKRWVKEKPHPHGGCMKLPRCKKWLKNRHICNFSLTKWQNLGNISHVLIPNVFCEFMAIISCQRSQASKHQCFRFLITHRTKHKIAKQKSFFSAVRTFSRPDEQRII